VAPVQSCRRSSLARSSSYFCGVNDDGDRKWWGGETRNGDSNGGEGVFGGKESMDAVKDSFVPLYW
jgi:hypothetical protein